MKITVDVELSESEMGMAQHITKALQGLADNVQTSIHTDKTALTRAIVDAISTSSYDGIVSELSRRLSRPELAGDVMAVLNDLLFANREGLEAVQLVQLLSWLPDPVRIKVREEVLAKLVSFLSIPRRMDTPRDQLIPYGEVFAAYVKLEGLGVKGALSVLIHLIRSESTRAAGLTALGKVVEIAADLISDRCDAGSLEQLRATLAAAQDDPFLYDIEYISEPLGWSQNPPARGSGTLQFHKACRHHTKATLSVVYNSTRDIVVSSSLDGSICTWDCASNGNLIESCTLARHFASAVDTNSRGNILLVCGAGQTPDTTPALIYYAEENNHWTERGAVQPEGTRVVSSARILRGQQGFFFACGLYGAQSTVAYYDGQRGALLREYHEHTDVDTLLFSLRAIGRTSSCLVLATAPSTFTMSERQLPRNLRKCSVLCRASRG